MATFLGELIAKFTADDSDFVRGLQRTKQAMGDTAREADRVGARMSRGANRAGMRMSVGATAPLMAMGANATKAYTGYESNINMFGATLELTKQQMDGAKRVALELGAAQDVPAASAADAAAVMNELAKGGLTYAQTLEAAKGTMQGAIAGQIDFIEMAKIQSQTLAMFGLQGKDAARVSDLLAGAANATSTEMIDNAYAFKMAGAVAKQSGMSIEDLTTAIALLGKNGLIGSDAGTSLKSMLLKLKAPSEIAKGAMKDIGFSAYDAKGKMKPLTQIIDELNQKTKGLTQERRDAIFGDIFGSDAIRAVNILLDEGNAGWKKMNKSVTKSGWAARTSKARMQGLNGAIEQLKSSVETTGIALIQVLAPGMEKVAKKVTELADWINGLSDTQKKWVGGMAIAVAAAGPFLMILSKLITAGRMVGKTLGYGAKAARFLFGKGGKKGLPGVPGLGDPLERASATPVWIKGSDIPLGFGPGGPDMPGGPGAPGGPGKTKGLKLMKVAKFSAQAFAVIGAFMVGWEAGTWLRENVPGVASTADSIAQKTTGWMYDKPNVDAIDAAIPDINRLSDWQRKAKGTLRQRDVNKASDYAVGQIAKMDGLERQSMTRIAINNLAQLERDGRVRVGTTKRFADKIRDELGDVPAKLEYVMAKAEQSVEKHTTKIRTEADKTVAALERMAQITGKDLANPDAAGGSFDVGGGGGTPVIVQQYGKHTSPQDVARVVRHETKRKGRDKVKGR